MPLLTALVIGCNYGATTDEAPPEDGSASVTSDDGTVDLPQMEDTEPVSSSPSEDTTGQPSSDEGAIDTTSDSANGDVAQDDQSIKQELNARLQEAIGNRDLPAALSALEEGMRKLPGDPELAQALIALRIQNTA